MEKDYIGLKMGLEIHQQLDTHKLFCNCPSVLRNDEPDYVVRRKLHAVAGESGEVDIAAKHEAEQDKSFIYQGYDTTCLLELDEEPPYLINEEALKIGLHVALLLNCEILPITQVMRKTVVDGSNTSGFQRTVMIARNGYVKTDGGKVRIDSVLLEEDAARKVSEEKGKKTFRLDRLGIPLIEIGTAPDIKSPKQAKEVALLFGDILRSCKVKRGIGTIRQDVNISTTGHPRIEIKGFQDVKMFIPTILEEIKRQEKGVASGKEIVGEVRNALENGKTEFLRPISGAARMYPETDLPLLKINRKLIDEAKRSLPKLRSEIKEELKKKGLMEEEIGILLKSEKLDEFSELIKINNDVRFVYKVLVEIPKSFKGDSKITDDIIENIIRFVKEGKLGKDDVKYVISEIASGKSFEEAVMLERVELEDVEGEIAKLIKEKPGLTVGGYMGLIMQKFNGKVSGKEVNEILNKLL